MNLLILAASLLCGLDENWPEFRGPGGTGKSDAVGLPHEWSEEKNVVWKTPIPLKGWSSPVVWGKQVWLTTATPNGSELYVICVDRESGKVTLNEKLFDAKPPQMWEKFNSYASPTPVIEEGRVYVSFGSPGTACLDTKTGKALWTRTDLACDHWRGAGSSPILHGDLLIIPFDGFDFQYVVALDKKTGKTVWKTDRTHDYKKINGEKIDGDSMKNYCTPIVIEVEGKSQLITTAAAMPAVAHDPLTGKEIWNLQGRCHSTGTRPLFGHGLVYVCTANPYELLAIKPGAGALGKDAVVWKANKDVPQKPSPILVDDVIYMVNHGNGVASGLDAKTGQTLWTGQRMGGSFTASPLFADGVVYFFGDNGTCVTVKHGRTYQEIARSKIEAGISGTPAISGKSLFIRTEKHLYRIEKKGS
jgi:outer membrane protein assembly factor BamB